MSETIPILKQIRESAGMQMAVLFGSFVIFLILSTLIGGEIDSLSIGDKRNGALLASAVQGVLAFGIPAFLLARFASNKPENWLKINKPFSVKAIFGVLILYVLSMPALEWLIEWNQNLHLPQSLSSLEETLRSWEDTNSQTSNTLLQASGFGSVVIGVLVIGVLTGVVEELFFRGGVQGIFMRSKVGLQSSIWIAAFVFSFMHFQFFGFLPRLLMGAFFGYLLVWTNDLKVSMFAHIFNNSIVVVVAAVNGIDSLSTTSILPGSPFLPILSLASTSIFLWLFRGYFFKDNFKLSLPWQKKQLPPISGR